MGAGADVVSEGELRRALLAGIPAAKIVYSGVAKTAGEMRFALQQDILQFNVESEQELEVLNQVALEDGKQAPVAFRINPDIDARTHAKISTGKASNKFGISWKRAHAVYDRAANMPGIRVQGIDIHIGSQLTELGPFEDAFKCHAELIVSLLKRGHSAIQFDNVMPVWTRRSWRNGRQFTRQRRHAKIDGARHAWAILALLVKRLRQTWPQVKIILRGDSGFCRWKMLSWCERKHVGYIVGIARIEHTDKGSNPRYVVTNLKGEGKTLYDKLYCARGEMENRIKEQQLDLFADRTSCHRWWPNQFRLLLSSLAYMLLEAIRRLTLQGTELANAYVGTLRLKLLKVGAIILRNTRRIRFLLSSAYPHQRLFFHVAARLAPG